MDDVKIQLKDINDTSIQVDSKSSEKFYALVEKLVACYRSAHPSTDIFLSTANLSLVKQKNNPVLKVFNAIAFKVWQHSSLLEGDLACLQQLQQKNSQWKFYLNIVRKSSEKTIQNVQLEIDKKHNRATICSARLAPSSP